MVGFRAFRVLRGKNLPEEMTTEYTEGTDTESNWLDIATYVQSRLKPVKFGSHGNLRTIQQLRKRLANFLNKRNAIDLVQRGRT